MLDGTSIAHGEHGSTIGDAVREAVHAYHVVVRDLLRQTELLVTAVDRLTGERERRVPGESGSDLTRRELHVLRLLAEGSANRAIARDLQISERTVKNHLQSIYGKLRVADRTAAVVKAMRIGLIAL
jgi:DNA-binding NarL/FixJ family response regulator